MFAAVNFNPKLQTSNLKPTMSTNLHPEPALHWPDAIEMQMKRGRDIKKAVDDNGGGIVTTDLTSAITDAQTAEDAVATKAPGTVKARNGKFDNMKLQCELVMDLVYEASLVMEYAVAAAFILACGFFLKGSRGIVNKELFEAKNGEVSGTLELIAKAADDLRQAHEWYYSIDKGMSWIYLPTTLTAKTTMTGLERTQHLYFRHRIILKDGPTDWHYDDVVVL
jgi:hypothetical protein